MTKALPIAPALPAGCYDFNKFHEAVKAGDENAVEKAAIAPKHESVEVHDKLIAEAAVGHAAVFIERIKQVGDADELEALRVEAEAKQRLLADEAGTVDQALAKAAEKLDPATPSPAPTPTPSASSAPKGD